MNDRHSRRRLIKILGGPRRIVESGIELAFPSPVPLPAELAPWHVYSNQTGHVILAELEDPVVSASTQNIGLLPIPVRAVLASEWYIDNGMVPVVKAGIVKFHSRTGLQFNPDLVDKRSGRVSSHEMTKLHRQILDETNEIRVLNRWGWTTDYAVRCSRKTAERAWGKPLVEVPASATFRARWSMSIDTERKISVGRIIEVQAGNEPWRAIQEFERTSFRSEHLFDQVTSYLDFEVPEHIILESIDRLNLQAYLDLVLAQGGTP